MIFVTVGANTPFDRLVHAVDRWAADTGRSDVFAQVGASRSRPQHIVSTQFLDPAEFHQKFLEASLIIAHAGTGTMLTALQLGKRIVIMPRHAENRETRNNHQIAMAVRFREQNGVYVVMHEAELPSTIERALADISMADQVQTAVNHHRISRFAAPRLINTIRSFIGKE